MNRKKIKILSFLTLSLGLILLLFYSTLIFSDYPYKNKSLLDEISFSQQIFDRHDTLLRLTLSEDDKYRIRGKLSEINPQFINATLLYEDRYYYSHFGVNPFSLARAFFETYVLKKRVIGASTISMQTARLIFGIKSNTLAGKFEQIWRAMQMEVHHSKDEILEAYFNLAPYGGNIEGIFSASQIYFHKKSSELALLESLALAVIPQNPVARNPLYGEDFDRVRSLFMEKWKEHYPQYQYANLPLKIYKINNLPFEAPHFTNKILSMQSKNAHESLQVKTSLDLPLQKNIESTIESFIQRSKLYGIENAAALLVHVPTMEIRSYVGSAGFYNKKIEGENDALDSLRSPGSTLKPFIYALAMEQGIIHEGSILLDIPTSFGDYNPENFNAEYSGPLPASDALKMSRNIPAIHLSNKINSPDLYDFLKSANINFPQDKEYYGLSLTLGGAEIKALDIARLYAMLLNQGLDEELVYFSGERGNSKAILSKESSAITLKMLENDLNINARLKSSQNGTLSLRIKTGTSNGFRDAWAVGTFGEYILLVWLGNFDNSSNQHLIGAQVATPLFYDISTSLSRILINNDLLEENIKNSQMKTIEICADTGDIDIALCPENNGKKHKSIYVIPGKTPIRDTGYLRKILIDNRTGKRICQKTLENSLYVEEKIAEFWPSDMQNYYKQVGIYKEAPPPFDAESVNNLLCKASDEKGLEPFLQNPKEGITYYINDENPSLYLMAHANADSAWVYWFVNDVYVGQSENSENFIYTPKSEQLKISAVDVFGRSTTKYIVVENQ